VRDFHSGLTPRLEDKTVAGRGPGGDAAAGAAKEEDAWDFGFIGRDKDNYEAKSRGISVPDKHSFFVCKHLPPRSAYQFRFRYVSAQGVSAWSPPSAAVATLGAPPMPPEPPEMEARSDSIITVGWRLARANGYVVDLFEVQVATASSVKQGKVGEVDLGGSLEKEYEGFVREALRAQRGETCPVYEWSSVTLGCEEQSMMVTGLRPSTEYVFRVRGKSEVGWGAFSDASEPITTKRRAI
jgi:hypothetical protein